MKKNDNAIKKIRAENQQIVILDGSRSRDTLTKPTLTLLSEVLLQYNKTRVQNFALRNTKLNHCIGCFHCWLTTPGQCIYHNDQGAEILQAILSSTTIILVTPIIFGGYSSELKKLVDRFLPMVLPFFKKAYGETHHPPRYSTFPHIISIGVLPAPDKKLTECFKTLVGRNALNLPPSHFSVEVINSTQDSQEKIRERLHTVLGGADKPPLHSQMQSLSKHISPSFNKSTKRHRALIITGSPKINNKSTSAVLGNCLVKNFKKLNIETETLTLTKNLLHSKEQHHLCSAVNRADTVLLTSPLYFDSLPFLVTQALELIAADRKNKTSRDSKIFSAVINNGLPESYQNTVALAICKNFAVETGMLWAGGLAMGTGEGLISGKSLEGFRGFGGYKRPPLLYISRSLKMTVTALANGNPVPKKAIELIAKKPIPFIPFNSWRTYVIKTAKRLLENEARKNGLTVKKMFERPYAK